MSTICIREKSITDFDADVIVNAANAGLQAGGGVCGAIFMRAGWQELQEACDRIGRCDTGKAVITPGFRTRAKYIVHAVGPIWNGGKNHEAELLAGCYRESLRLAIEHNCRTIVFPLISSGIYGYPKEEAWEVALRACRDFLRENPDQNLDVTFAVLDRAALEQGEKVLRETAPEYVRE